MNTIIISPLAADPNRQQPFTAPSLTFLQASTKEVVSNILQGVMPNGYDPTKVYILYGCVNSTSGSTFTISAGAVFYNGEVYRVDAVTFTSPGGQTAVAKIVTTNPTPDPILLKDGTSVSVHNVINVVIASAVSGTGISDFIGFVSSSFTEIQTDTSNGLSLDVHITASGPFAYTNLVTNYSYRTIGKRCELDFNVTFDVTDGAVVDQIKIPLPAGIVKNTTLNTKYSARGTCAFIAPASTTSYAACYINSIDDGTEGQRLVIRALQAVSAEISISTSSSVVLQGHIDFQLS